MRRARSWLSGLALLLCGRAQAATLPDVAPLDVIVISDEVNPNNLSAAQLTQPGDVSAALNAVDSGVPLIAGGAHEFDSQCVDDGLARLQAATPPDVLVYFAHRAARSCAGSDVQPALTSAVEQLLIRGGGLVVFHHGVYQATGKAAILQLIGAQSNSISWNTSEGQRVIAIAPGHFVTSNGIRYDRKVTLAAFTGVAAGEYDAFVNVPDERYPVTELLDSAGATRTVLFASDSGGTRVISHTLTRPGWKGKVVTYQPGEYQPNALDQRAGNNFQILANALVFAAGRVDAAGQIVAGGASAGGASAGGASAGGVGAGGKAGAGGGAGGAGRAGSPAGGTAMGAGGATAGAGTAATGGIVASGGMPAASGGATANGGGPANGLGGTPATGGVAATGGTAQRGGAGGDSGAGGSVTASGAGGSSGGVITPEGGSSTAPTNGSGCGCVVAGRRSAFTPALALLAFALLRLRRQRR